MEGQIDTVIAVWKTYLEVVTPTCCLPNPPQEMVDKEAKWLAQVKMPLEECTFEEAQEEVRKVLDGTIQRTALRIEDEGYKAFVFLENLGTPLEDAVIFLYQNMFELKFSQRCAKDFHPDVEGS